MEKVKTKSRFKKTVIFTALMSIMLMIFAGFALSGNVTHVSANSRATASVCSLEMPMAEEVNEDVIVADEVVEEPTENEDVVEEPSTDGEVGDETADEESSEENTFVEMIGNTVIEIFALENVSAFSAGIITIVAASVILLLVVVLFICFV